MLKPFTNKIVPLIILPLIVSACTLNSPSVTKAKYDQVKTGMTVSEIEKIIGKPGESSGEISFTIPGVPNLPSGNKQAIYQWKNPDGSAMTGVFVDDKLVFKVQVNLK
ncbi:hypothetical protein [Microseira wollei]|uniref:Lipoprotein SmpA/OmlA domain-containing protein n=1 Tax=Microseira wollei NIES-4236 TaxID=2530354 RepID=A0AAV3X9R1_9CYAN|nr:hypothetical protein [Microseira wollei]GET37455.1 hypothetical protein MiSe_22080 [Microseira wollei NIES-4236]